LTCVRHLSYTHLVTINYMQMLLDLMEERQRWLNQRDEAIREISRLSELIRATMNMVPAEQIARYEPIFERLENRPLGLSMAIRACYTGVTPATLWAEFKGAESRAERANAEERATQAVAEKDAAEKNWLTPVEIRDALKRMGFPFENYKANPLASIHTTLKRMVPAEMETKTLKDGQKVYRLKSAGEWTQAFAEVRQWLTGSFSVMEPAGNVVAVRRSQKEKDAEAEQEPPPAEGAKRGTSGGA
jgi:hypothetical protein